MLDNSGACVPPICAFGTENWCALFARSVTAWSCGRRYLTRHWRERRYPCLFCQGAAAASGQRPSAFALSRVSPERYCSVERRNLSVLGSISVYWTPHGDVIAGVSRTLAVICNVKCPRREASRTARGPHLVAPAASASDGVSYEPIFVNLRYAFMCV